MSGIAAIYNRTGRPLDPEAMTRMLGVIAHRGPDARGIWSGGSIGLGHALLVSTPDAVSQRQPLTTPDETACVTFDGRIDNRAEIQAALEAANIEFRTSSDADLMLGAYRAWGDAFPEKVLGDFALIIWDARRRQLLCARDILGLRPCYYYADEHVFLCGSEPQQLFAAGLKQPAPNEGMVGEYLSDRITSREETLFQNVFRLPAAHILLVGPDFIVKRRYFNLDPSREVRYRTDAEYAEHYMSLFTEAVRCRLHSTTPVAAYLSGGLDSSSIVSLLAHLSRGRAIPDISLETFSMVASGAPGDESAYIHDVVRQWNLTSNEFEVEPPVQETFINYVSRYRELPAYPNVTAAAPLARAAAEKGFRVILTGLGGDDWLCNYESHSDDLLARFRCREFLRDRRTQKVSVGGAARDVVRHFLPRKALAAIKRLRGRNGIPAHISPSFAREASLADRLEDRPNDFPAATPAQNEQYRWFGNGGLAHGHEVDDRHHAWFGLDARHPFHDRRLVEFSLAIPEEQRWQSDYTKFVLRNAMGDLLPAPVRRRLTKGDYSQTLVHAFDALGGERYLHSLESIRRGWVREDGVVSMYQEMRSGCPTGTVRHGTTLWMVFAIELWLRHAFD